MDVSLVMVKADGSSKEVKIDRDATIIGRDEHARFRIPLSSISRRHCEVRVDNDGVTVADLGSANGTYVNGKRVRQAELAPGDILCVGPIVFVVRIDGHPRNIDVKDSFAAGSVTDDSDDTGEMPSPVSPTKSSVPQPTSGSVPAPAPVPAAAKPAKGDDDDDDDGDINDLLKDFDFGDDDDDDVPKKKP